ncbi:hypothetical protein H5410_014798 [Solanum commersonii]|uniref:Uncharacterized protein n=1 Tax=Solanum commersonii TaxID=4109 RepID=A0A9J5ZRY5_SOLCO|nr:hypothetical protein H5410_014798 [Solanum commersonii]
MIEPNGSSWHHAKDATWALKDYVRRLYTQAYHSWSETPNRICQAMFNDFIHRLYFCLKGIGLSRQVEALDSVQIATMSAQIAQLTAVLAESEQRRVAEQ